MDKEIQKLLDEYAEKFGVNFPVVNFLRVPSGRLKKVIQFCLRGGTTFENSKQAQNMINNPDIIISKSAMKIV